MVSFSTHGEMSERFKEPVLKTGDGATHRGFESHSLRQIIMTTPCGWSLLFHGSGIRMTEYNCPVDSCLIPARRNQHHSVTNPTLWKSVTTPCGWTLLFHGSGIRMTEYNCPVDSCLIPARRNQHHSVTNPTLWKFMTTPCGWSLLFHGGAIRRYTAYAFYDKTNTCLI